MHFGRCRLSLGSLWQDNPIVLLARTDAFRLCQGRSCIELAPREAGRCLEALDRLPASELREFVGAAQLSRQLVSDLDGADLVLLIRQAVADGRLVAVKEGADSVPASDSTALQRKLVRMVERLTRRLRWLGRQYQLVADADLKKMFQRDRYEVMRRDEARQVLDGLAKGEGASPLGQLLREASANLTPDWRPPFTQPDGIILLRRTITIIASDDEAPPITPAQLKALMQGKKVGWIGIRLVDESDAPVAGIKYRITLPDSSSCKGALDGEGHARVDNVIEGDCRIEFPELEADAWHKPGGGPSVVATGADHTFVVLDPDFDFGVDVEEDDDFDFEADARDDSPPPGDEQAAAEAPGGAAPASARAPEPAPSPDEEEDFDLDFEQDVEEDLELELEATVDESAA